MDFLEYLYMQPYDAADQVRLSGVNFHRCILKQYEYFQHAFKYKDGKIKLVMSEHCAVLFKKWVYRQNINFNNDVIDCAKKEHDIMRVCKEVYDLSNFLKIRFFIDHIKNYLWRYVDESQNSDIHFTYFKDYSRLEHSLKITSEQVSTLDVNSWHYNMCLYKGIGCKRDTKRAFEWFKHSWEENKHADSLHLYAFCLLFGNGCEKDEKKAVELFKYNWEVNKHNRSLHFYAYCLYYGHGCERQNCKALHLFMLNWDENRNLDSLLKYTQIEYARQYRSRRARMYPYIKLMWEEYGLMQSLFMYAECVGCGYGCVRRSAMSMNLHKLNWEKYKNADSLYCYATYLKHGAYRINISLEKAFELFRLNWEENKHKESLREYIDMLKTGKGCEKNEQLANELAVYLRN